MIAGCHRPKIRTARSSAGSLKNGSVKVINDLRLRRKCECRKQDKHDVVEQHAVKSGVSHCLAFQGIECPSRSVKDVELSQQLKVAVPF